MKRRDYIKTFSLGSVMPFTSTRDIFADLIIEFFKPAEVSFRSNWQNWPDMKWAGPEYWGNCLQDWCVKKGKLVCDYSGQFRTLHLLTLRNEKGDDSLNVSVKINKLNDKIHEFSNGCVGLLLGAKGPFEDYRSAAVFGTGLQVGLNPVGKLIVGKQIFETGLSSFPDNFIINLKSESGLLKNILEVNILDTNNNELFKKGNIVVESQKLVGNFALLANLGNNRKEERHEPSVSFEQWNISSPSLHENKSNLFGPICFAQYTLHNNKLKLTGQFAPIEQIGNHKVLLQFKKDGIWKTYEERKVSHKGRAINFQVSGWNAKETPYRLKVLIPVGEQLHEYIYDGTIAEEPIRKDELKVAVFSCNFHYGFPDNDICEAIEMLTPDVSVFLGDQFYEGTGGYGVRFTGDFDKKCLDYLRKWMMFGWSYREIFRHIPCAIIPDDHDVFHGNLWGEKGKEADTSNGYGASAQDSGGYKMEAEWVNMVQFTQTSHLPDAYDPTPVLNNIGVYYTKWNYAGISFAIIEDRKFKSAPKLVLPQDAQVYNGWIYNKDFNIKQHADIKANLLGDRQEKFLEHWVEDWSANTQMKVVLSQTNFSTVATLPEGSMDGSVIPGLKIPEKGEYIEGDKPTVDMDSNGWPKNKRDKAISILRKGLAFHIAGDQHLGSFIQYGLDDHEDSCFAFAGPALNNYWPRRFWPPVDYSKHSYEDPAYTGNFTDGFGNYFTLHAVANPYKRHKEPEVLYDRANGYGMVTFNKKNRTIKTDCYERFKDPVDDENPQFPGWPIEIKQEDNYLKKANFFLPTLKINNKTNWLPVLKVFESGELVYALRLPQNTFQPRTLKKGKFNLTIEIPEKKVQRDLGRFSSQEPENKKVISVYLS